jgi:HD-GYP domain-containing protein (c-di-GMP phosphodiesterase class II)
MNARVDDLVTLLSRGIAQRAIYFAEHPKVLACSRELAQRLTQEIAGDEAGFFLGSTEGRLIHEGRMLLGASIIGRKVAAFLDRLGSGGLLFRRGIEAQELATLFGLAVAQTEALAGGLGAARALLAANGVRHIELSPRFEDEDWFGRRARRAAAGDEESEGLDGLGEMIPIYQSLFETVETAHRRAVGDHALDIDGARSASERFLNAAGGSFTDMMQLVRYPDADSYTVGHSVRVAMLCVLVGQYLGLPRPRLTELGTAGLLHDVGKAKVPDEILYKNGRLDPDELRIMRVHPEAGAKILLESGEASTTAVCAAWGHHLRHDLRGYPAVPGWAVQGETTALLQVCDVFEALTAVRPYKPAATPLRAYEIMFADPGAFHPSALRALVAALGIYPPGSRVRLDDGSRAVVVSAGERVDRPRLRVVRDAAGSPIAREDQPLLDLGDPTAAGIGVDGLIAGVFSAEADPGLAEGLLIAADPSLND